MSPPPPLVLHSLLPSELLDYVLTHLSATSTLVVCSTRDAFLYELQACVRDGAEPGERLIIPTLQLIAASRSIHLAFSPTLHHLRAYLSAFHSRTSDTLPATSEFPALCLVNPVALHRSLPDHSAQGLSRTFAAAVDTAARSCMRLMVVEYAAPPASSQDGGNGANKTVWDEQVPLLNGTVMGLRGEERGWTGRTVKIRRVLERWFVFSEDDNHNAAMT
ncbi:hypothetical protein FGG08_000377 [Glutinoglossum americanum]|uniref:Uncharacterized protein n=1 Tax=Glutinoglossum americanum TaxID=1670608 RepID=A0A9P8L3V0_9PEZI|nr:hypothetical protein FGG08_000377 [Glutinoglossum americanum]